MLHTRMRIGSNGWISIPMVNEKGRTPILTIGPGVEEHHSYLQAKLPNLEDLQGLPIGIANADANELRIEPMYLVCTAAPYRDTILKTSRVFATGNVEGTLYYVGERRNWHHWKRRVDTVSHQAIRVGMIPLEAGTTVGFQISSRARGVHSRRIGVLTPRPCGHLQLFAKLHFMRKAPQLSGAQQVPWDNPLKSFLPTGEGPVFTPPSHADLLNLPDDLSPNQLPGYDEKLMAPKKKLVRKKKRKTVKRKTRKRKT